jgi:hypothetical protein
MAPIRGISARFARWGGEPILFPFAQFSLLQWLCHVELSSLKVIAYSGGDLLDVRVHVNVNLSERTSLGREKKF